jgi:hypothetical protein
MLTVPLDHSILKYIPDAALTPLCRRYLVRLLGGEDEMESRTLPVSVRHARTVGLYPEQSGSPFQIRRNPSALPSPVKSVNAERRLPPFVTQLGYNRFQRAASTS